MLVKRRMLCGVLLLSLPLVFGGCGSVTDYVTPSVVLSDTALAQLESVLVVTMGGYDPATRDLTQLDINISSQGHPVQLVADEQIVCNNVTLQRFVGSFEASFPTAAVAGKSLTCTYTSGQASTSFTLTLPVAPAILSPPDQARVSREAHTVVRFQAPAGSVTGVVALAPASKAVAHQDTMSSSQAILDTRPLAAGAGSISLTEDLALPASPNPGFKSFRVRGTAMTMVAVTWV